MFDVFYLSDGRKPNLFPHERGVESIQHAQKLSRTRYFWIVNYLLDYTSFDFLYEPKPWQAQFTHVWPSQHHEFSGTYLVPKEGSATDYHFHQEVILLKHNKTHFKVLHELADFDFTWKPHPHDKPYIYVFGNQWHPGNRMPTVEYRVPGATDRKYIDSPKATLPVSMQGWDNRTDARYQFDYSWVPDPHDPPMTYVFGNQWWPAEKMPTVQYAHPNITEDSPIKYMSYPSATLVPMDVCWEIPPEIDPATVDTSWCPDPGDPPLIYQFATQHQKTGGPRYVTPSATEVKYMSELKTRVVGKATAIVEIDHLDGNAGQIPDTTKTVRYFDNYRDTLVRIAKNLNGEHEYVWICSSICNYKGFDFSWHPEQWQATMLHVFPSNEQKFGDTFFMHVPTFAEYGDKKALLEWYDVNYVDQMVTRRRLPVIEHTEDSHVDAVKNTDWAGPLALFTTTGLPMTIPTVPLWRTEVKTVMPLSVGASAVIVPKVAKGDIKTQLYDYPYIDKTQRKRHSDQPLDIVFISNGENEADFLYQWLVDSVGGNSFVNGSYRIKRVENVKGRVAAYQAAANASTTPWFFAVFAKLQVNKEFDWNWQPDRMQQAKHYIFHAINPVNGLTYGHQAMIAYNKKLVLENEGLGLDFTLDQPHEVVPIVSGQANYYTSNWMCWRTAFREVLKLKASLPDVENEYRLNQWLTVDNTQAKWSMKGAQDAVEFYDSVNGNPTELQKSYEWDWLASYAFMKRSLVAN